MAIVNVINRHRIEVDMTDNSDSTFEYNVGDVLDKDKMSSVQIATNNLSGTIGGTIGLKVTNFDQNDTEYYTSFLDTMGTDVNISSSFSKTYSGTFCFNTVLVRAEGISGINGGKIIIVLNK